MASTGCRLAWAEVGPDCTGSSAGPPRQVLLVRSLQPGAEHGTAATGPAPAVALPAHPPAPTAEGLGAGPAGRQTADQPLPVGRGLPPPTQPQRQQGVQGQQQQQADRGQQQQQQQQRQLQLGREGLQQRERELELGQQRPAAQQPLPVGPAPLQPQRKPPAAVTPAGGGGGAPAPAPGPSAAPGPGRPHGLGLGGAPQGEGPAGRGAPVPSLAGWKRPAPHQLPPRTRPRPAIPVAAEAPSAGGASPADDHSPLGSRGSSKSEQKRGTGRLGGEAACPGLPHISAAATAALSTAPLVHLPPLLMASTLQQRLPRIRFTTAAVEQVWGVDISGLRPQGLAAPCPIPLSVALEVLGGGRAGAASSGEGAPDQARGQVVGVWPAELCFRRIDGDRLMADLRGCQGLQEAVVGTVRRGLRALELPGVVALVVERQQGPGPVGGLREGLGTCHNRPPCQQRHPQTIADWERGREL
jgi:hypothetical protein